MADTITLPGSGAVVGTDEVTIATVLQHLQRMKLYDGTDGGTEAIPGTAARGLLTETSRLGNAGTATLSNVTSATSTASLLAANSSRKGAIVQNDSTANLFLKYGATASTTSYTVKVPAGALWEMPHPIYTGAIDCIWDAANGAARATELT